jgi:hypothetical protein
MKNIAAITLFVVTAFVAAGRVRAQDHVLKATIPFNFTVGEREVPAGSYAIRSNMVALPNYDKKVGDLSAGQSGESNTLLFHKYGNQYFLSEIRSADSTMNIHVALN